MNKNSILYTAVIVSFLAILCKVVGFIRESIMASYFGASADTDAFFLASSMPGTIFPAVCNSLSTAFIPIYITKFSNNKNNGDKYASRMLLLTLKIGILLSIVGTMLASKIVPLIASGFNNKQINLTIRLTRIVMASFVLNMLQYMLGAILNSKKIFIVVQLANLVQNLIIIIEIAAWGKGQSMEMLTFATVIASISNVIILLLGLRKNFVFTSYLTIWHYDSFELLKLSLPILLGNSIVQINEIVDKFLGSQLAQGSLSALSYGNTLTNLVINIFVTSLSTVLYPNLADAVANGDRNKYRNSLSKSITGLSLLLFPITMLTLSDADNIVSIAFKRGNFSEVALSMTSTVLLCYAFRFVFAGVREVLSRAYFAVCDTKTPMVIGTVSVIINIFCSIALTKFIGLAGIAIGTTISVAVNAILLFGFACIRLKAIDVGVVGVALMKQAIAVLPTFFVINLKKYLFFNTNYFITFLIDIIIGFGIYFGMLFLMKEKSLLYIWNKMKEKIDLNKKNKKHIFR